MLFGSSSSQNCGAWCTLRWPSETSLRQDDITLTARAGVHKAFPSKSKKNQVLRSKEIRQRCGREPIESFENLLGHWTGKRRQLESHLICGCLDEGNPSSRNLKGAQKYFRLSWTLTKEWTLNQKPAIMKAYNILLLQGLLYRTQVRSLPDHVLL